MSSTGVFCNTAIESAGADKDIRTLKQIQDKAQQVELLKGVFDEIDFEQVNEISFDDVKRCLANGDLSSFMESMGAGTVATKVAVLCGWWALCGVVQRNGAALLRRVAAAVVYAAADWPSRY